MRMVAKITCSITFNLSSGAVQVRETITRNREEVLNCNEPGEVEI